MATVKPKSGQNQKWVGCDLSQIFEPDSLQKLLEDAQQEVSFAQDNSAPPAYDFPDFGANRLRPAALKHLCGELSGYLQRAVAPVSDIPACMILERRAAVWDRVRQACQQTSYEDSNHLRRVFVTLKEEEGEGKKEEKAKSQDTAEKLTGNEILIEVGVKTGLSIMFSMLRQAWAQLAWQRQLEQQLQATGAVVPFPGGQVNLPNEVLRSILGVLKGIPPLSLANLKTLSKLSMSCLEQSSEFLTWILQPDSNVDSEGKRLACEIIFSLALQHGNLNALIELVEKVLECLGRYEGNTDASKPSLSLEFCHNMLEEIRKRAQVGALSEEVEYRPFEPRELTAEGYALLQEFTLFLCQELSELCQRCTSYFSRGAGEDVEEHFLSETCEVFAFGSNSSSQLAMGSAEKFPRATLMPHLANCQLVEAGQYCSFVVYGDGMLKACGKGSYGRLGLGNSDTQSTLKTVSTFPEGTVIRKIISSRGSDGHSVGITASGQAYSWGDGNYGKLGHGDNTTHKVPKLIAAFADKVVRNVACGNRHSAAVTVDGELYTWGEGDYGRLGHGNTVTLKTPTKVEAVEPVRQAACGAAHTLVLSMDGLTVYSFGSGDSGKLGHGDTNRQTTPKVIESLRGMMCQKVCAASQFSLVLTAGGKVYSFGNGSGVGKGTTEPRQYTPWLIEALDGEMIIDVTSGDGHSLALTQRGEVYAWGTNSMGQCGQGHSNGSITTPAKVLGLEGVQVQQISSGTSHSIVWTAVPTDRRASAMWHWPYCVSVGEKTFKGLLSLLNTYGNISGEPLTPFQSRESQESFLLSLLSLTRTHLGLAAPLGPSCVHMACGTQVKPLRNFLFKLIDSQLPSALDQVTSEALEVGSSVLLPPVLDRLELLLAILPEDPTQLASLTTGQSRQLDILLSGFQDRGELAGILTDEAWLDGAEEEADNWSSSQHTPRIFTLCGRMINYIHISTVSGLDRSSHPPLHEALRLGSPLLCSFQHFLLSVYINVLCLLDIQFEWGDACDQLLMPSHDQLCVKIHFELFDKILREHSLPLVRDLAARAREQEDPEAFLLSIQDVLFGFLVYELPSHIALSLGQVPGMAVDLLFDLQELLLELARAVHEILALLPPSFVEGYEREELQWDPINVKPDKVKVTKLRDPDMKPWRRLADTERLLCYAAAELAKFMYTSSGVSDEFESSVLDYSPGKGKASLLSSHLLSNGAVGGKAEIAEAVCQWVSLCKRLPEPSEDPQCDWASFLQDYKELRKSSPCVYHAHLDLGPEPEDISPCDLSSAPPLFVLAVGAKGNNQAEMIYDSMMEFAIHRDWNTCSDEDALPQLRRVSCATLACLLKHTGLFLYASNCRTKPKKKLVDVYRSVFSLRREVFTNRPLPDSEGKISEEDQRNFEDTCSGICATLLLFTCLLNPALPEESEPIVPQITTSAPSGPSSSTDDAAVRSPGSSGYSYTYKTAPLRLFSHPEIRDDSPISPQRIQDPSISHSASHTSASPIPEQQQGWSLTAVKQALSRLRWQKDRMDMHTSTSTGSEGPLHQKVAGTIVDLVSHAFQKEEDLLSHRNLIHTLTCQQRRATYRRNALERMLRFASEGSEREDLLPSSRLIYLSNCLDHDIHYSENITAAPSVLQHEIKSLSHTLLEKILCKMLSLDPTQLSNSSVVGLQRELLLALQWVNFQHEPSDLYLIFSGELYPKVVTMSGVVSSRVPMDVNLSLTRLGSRLRMACVLVMQLLALRVGMNAEVLKSRPDILAIVSDHMFGQLEGYVCASEQHLVQRWEERECTVEEREGLLGEFLCFVNTLSASHEAIRSVLASDVWFSTLLKVVDINTNTGVPQVSSLKTRLLALQVLGAIMSELSDSSPEVQGKCGKIIEDLLELMYRCMFLAPVSHFQGNIKPSHHPSPAQQTLTFPFSIDPAHQHGCRVTVEGDSVLVEGMGGNGYALGQLTLNNGKYTWKVTVETANGAFCVGVAQKPLSNRRVGSSNQFWALESHTGRLYHEGESNELGPTLSEGDSIVVEYDAAARTLAVGKNDTPLAVVFHNVAKQGKDLFPFLLFPRRHNITKVRIHPVTHCSHSPLAHLKRKEQLTSGYPLLSPTGVSLTQAIVSIIYQLQQREPWSKAISQVICRRLGEMDLLIHRLLDLQAAVDVPEFPSGGGDTIESILSPLSLLMGQLTQLVWPCLAVVGGLDAGLCLGRECQVDGKEESQSATLVSIPDSEQKVQVQDQVSSATSEVKKRTVSLGILKLVAQKKFSLSLILEHLTPPILMNIAHLAGYLDEKHSISNILQLTHSFAKAVPPTITKCLPYQQLCESLLQMAATKSLHTILFDESVIKLLNYRPPPMDVVVAGGYVDKSELAQSVQDVLKCLALRAIKPSPLKPTLKMPGLEKVHALLSYECLASVAEFILHNGQASSKLAEEDSSLPTSVHESPSSSPPADDIAGSQREEGEAGGGGEEEEEEARPATPPVVHMLMDMGFSRPQINVALERCEIPPNTGEQARMNLLVTWVIDHPDAVSEEEARLEQAQREREAAEDRRRREEQQQQQEADQNAAASEFLSLFGEMFDAHESPTNSEEVEETRKETKHAPDLLEGPNINEEVPDVSLSGMDTSPQSLKSLLSALGLSQKRPTPKRFEFSGTDPLGEKLCKGAQESEGGASGGEEGETVEEDTPGSVIKLSPVSEELVQQVHKLRSLGEKLSAINRVVAATQTLVARHITMLVIASLSTMGSQSFIANLKVLGLEDVKSLVRLLRLVHAGRIDGTPGKSFSLKTASSLLPIKGLQCLSSAITTVVTESASAGSQLMQACSRDLLAAAVGGADLLQPRSGRRRRPREKDKEKEKSDVSVLSNPNFSVSQSLVQTMAEAAGKTIFSDNSGVLQMIDALAACLFSSKLEPPHRFWALEQLLKMLSTTKKEAATKLKPEDLVVPSQLAHYTGHKGQIMACAQNKKGKIVSIGEDNSLVLWDMENGTPEHPQLQTFPTNTSSTPTSGYLLPTLTQSFNHTCVAGALNDTVHVWRVRDGKTISETFPELVTALQWKPTQKDGEAPLLLIGLVDGTLTLVEVLRASVNLSPEIQSTTLEPCRGAVSGLSWSPSSSMFAVASPAGSVQVFSGSGREYTPTAEIRDLEATALSWSPDETLLATLEAKGTLKLWDVTAAAPSVCHTFDAYTTCCAAWHDSASSKGKMLLASGSHDGTVHLWVVEGKRKPIDQSDSEPTPADQSEPSCTVSHVTSLQGHQAPITSLAFSESSALLASGCKAGSVRVWDLKSFVLLKLATRAVGEVLNLSWTSHGLAICYKNTSTLCVLAPGPESYLEERCLHSCLPTLYLHSIPTKTPCLTALLKNLHHVLLDQYQYEEWELCSAQQLIHSEYLQLLTALAVGLGLHHVLVAPPHPPHFDPLPPPKDWQWLNTFNRAVKMAESLTKRAPLPEDASFSLPKDVRPLDPQEKYQTTDNSVWTLTMDSQILEWVSQHPRDWWRSTKSNVFTWGKGSWNQLGHSTREKTLPAQAEEWQDAQQVVAGSYSTYIVKFDGTVASLGEGSYGRLGHGGSENETNLRVISALQGIPIVQVVAGPRVSSSTDDGYALALTDNGDVYSWGKGYKGRLGHSASDNVRSPKLVEALAGREIKMLACCDYHCAAVTTNGKLYTFGSKENGKLGHGRDTPSGSVGTATQVTRFLDSDEQTELEDVRIGYVSCGQTFTIAISEDGSQVFGFGKGDHCVFGLRNLSGDHHYPVLLTHLAPFGPFVKSASGSKSNALINTRGQLVWFGKLCDNQGNPVEPEWVNFPAGEKIVDVQTADQYMLALTESGEVYSWGKNNGNTWQLGYEQTSNQTTPKLIESISGKNLKQISTGVRHAACSDTSLPVRGVTNLTIPSAVPAQYPALKEVPCPAIHARLLVLHHFSKLMISSWRLFGTQPAKAETAKFHINPLLDGNTRSLISPVHIEGMIAGVVSRTMVNKSHGPSITVQRIAQDERASRAVFPQIATQVLQKPARELRCPSRAWKVNLVGEGADDAGGVYDDTIAQICEELEGGVTKLLIPAPNATNKCGFNTDRYVFDPTCTSPKDMKHFRFLGVLFGVAMRTKKPLDLHLAQSMWKLIAGMSLTQDDLEEVDLMFIQTVYSIRDAHKNGIKEEDFSEMIPIESFEAQSMNGKFVPIIPGGSNIQLTYHNRKEYAEKALHFRLHELDQQVAAVREGMASIIPVPLLSLCTARMLQTAVCGSEMVDIQMLKKVVRYRDGLNESDQLAQWLWQTLEAFTNEERTLFLRFVSGRSRLPTRVSEIPQRFQIMKGGQSSDGLPTSQTCFFQLRLPSYSSQEMMAERLRYAIRNCRSIDMDNYMLRRNNSDYDYDSEDDDW